MITDEIYFGKGDLADLMLGSTTYDVAIPCDWSNYVFDLFGVYPASEFVMVYSDECRYGGLYPLTRLGRFLLKSIRAYETLIHKISPRQSDELFVSIVKSGIKFLELGHFALFEVVSEYIDEICENYKVDIIFMPREEFSKGVC